MFLTQPTAAVYNKEKEQRPNNNVTIMLLWHQANLTCVGVGLLKCSSCQIFLKEPSYNCSLKTINFLKCQ